MNEQLSAEELQKLFPGISRSCLARSAARSVSTNPVKKPDPGDEPVAPAKGKTANPVRRFVRVTSYRTCLLDERNLFDAYFVDALTYAGILFDDAPKWAEVKVSQELVSCPEYERTVIEITPWP